MDNEQIALVLLAGVTYVLAVALAIVDGAGTTDLFNNSIAALDAKYYQYVSPIGATFGIAWTTIYIWNLVGIGYIVYSLTLPDEQSPVKRVPTLVSKSFLVLFIVGWLATVGWLFAYDTENLELSLAMLLLSAFSFYGALGVSWKLVYDNEEDLKQNSPEMLWLMRILVQNGLGLPAAWLTVASLIGLADVLIYKDSPGLVEPIMRGGLSIQEGSTVSISVLVGIAVSWFFMENFALYKYAQYTFTIYPVLVIALAGVVARLNTIPEAQLDLVLAALGLVLVTLAFIAQIAIFAYRNSQTPPKSDEKKLVPLN